MAVVKRTWPYGTKYKAVVRSASRILLDLYVDEINEGFLLGGDHSSDIPKEGDKGTIVFTKGGATGGYWLWQPDNKKNA